MHNFLSAVTVKWLASKLELPFIGDPDYKILNISNLSCVSDSSLVFSKHDEHKIINGVVIANSKSDSGSVIISENPRFDFIRSLSIIDKYVGFESDNTSPDLHPTVSLGENVSIGKGVSIGKNTLIEPNAVILCGTSIGSNCIIRAGAVIGSCGFGFERDSIGLPLKFIHLGGVTIGDNVEIGSNSCIAKGTLDNTVVEDNVKIDNLVQISHNCHIQSGAFILSGAAISGSVLIGRNSWIGPNSVIHQKKKIGNNVLVGMGAVVTKSIKDQLVVFGNPAKKLFS